MLQHGFRFGMSQTLAGARWTSLTMSLLTWLSTFFASRWSQLVGYNLRHGVLRRVAKGFRSLE
eukprot:6455244-Amphidinium_carterae.1